MAELSEVVEAQQKSLCVPGKTHPAALLTLKCRMRNSEEQLCQAVEVVMLMATADQLWNRVLGCVCVDRVGPQSCEGC